MLQWNERRAPKRMPKPLSLAFETAEVFLTSGIFVEETHRGLGRERRTLGGATNSQRVIARRGARFARSAFYGEKLLQRAPFVGARQEAETEHGAVSNGNGAHGEDARRHSDGATAGLIVSGG